MASKSDKERKEAKAAAVVARLEERKCKGALLVGMFDERTLDVLILTLGLGHIELD